MRRITIGGVSATCDKEVIDTLMVTNESILEFRNLCDKIFEQIRRDVIGQTEVVEGTVIAMIAGGNVLLEGVPGVGKTRLVRSLGRVFNMPFSRIQFTPDLMPADVTGTNIIVKDDKGNSKFEFQPGPVFSNIILADEINRATPKTQSALLEAMQEHTVTVMGVSRKMNEPFFVLATQNPVEQDGTYPLPEAQMDRFMFKLIVPNPSLDELMQIVNMTQATMAEVASSVCSGAQLLEMRKTANQIPVADDVMKYAMTLCAATHPTGDCASDAAKKYVRLGASPRAGQALISAAKVKALMKGRYNVAYSDLNELAAPVLRHRMKMNFEAISERISPDDVVRMIVAEVSKRFNIAVNESAPEDDVKKGKKGKKDKRDTAETPDIADNEQNGETSAEQPVVAPVVEENGKKDKKEKKFGFKKNKKDNAENAE